MSNHKDALNAGTSSVSSELSPAMVTFARWAVGLFAFSVCWHLVAYFVFHASGHFVYPYSLNAFERFRDFTVFSDKFPAFHTEAFYSTGLPIIYPAPCWAVFNFFFQHTTPHELVSFVTFSTLAFVIPTVLFGRTLVLRGITPARAALFVTILCLFSWPAELIVDGANVEVSVWIAMVIAMWAYSTGRLWIAAVFFGLAASLKLFPFVFLALFLSRRNIMKAVVGAISFFAFSIGALAFAGPTLGDAYRGYTYGMTFAKNVYFTKWLRLEQGLDHSLFALYKGIVLFVVPHHKEFTPDLPYYTFATAIGGILLYIFFIRHKPLLNQVLIFSVVAIYFTPFSGDGTLIHLYYPLAMIFLLSLQAYRDGLRIPGLKPILTCMIACLCMESFLVVEIRGRMVRLIGPFHCVTLGALLICAFLYPLGPALSEGFGETILSRPVTGWLRKPASSV